METKVCTKCGEPKPLSQFWKQKQTPDGLAYACKTCRNEDKRALAAGEDHSGKRKVCTSCLRNLPLKAYRRDSRRTDGRQAMCKACRKEKYGGLSIWGWVQCKYCGDDLGDNVKTNRVCPECNRKSQAWLTGERNKDGQLLPGGSRPTVYLCVSDPADGAPFKGGHFSKLDMNQMLKYGYWNPGTVFECWKQGKYREHVKVVGPQLERQMLIKVEGREATGDQVFLRAV